MGQTDPGLFAQSSTTIGVWKTKTNIPKGAAFTTAFDIKQETPLCGPSCIRVFITLLSKLRLNTIKFDNEVFAYLKKHSVYINPDMFKCNDVISPGIITTVHRTLVCKDDLLARMRTQLQLCQVPDTKVCNQWLKENAPAHTPEQNAPLPKFCLTTTKASW
eukprot:2637172-Ditylum_brightwellii.AAC.1